VKPATVEYVRPSSIDEAVAWLAELGEDAKVLAGGQSLVPLLTMRLARPTVLIDINHVASLDDISHRDDAVAARALVRQADFAGASRLCDLCLPHIGHYVTRNRGTVCGSIAHADARAELPLALAALGGTVVAASRNGTRTIPADEFFVGHFTTALRPDELVLETVWPKPGDGWGFAFEELALRAGDYALGLAAVAIRVADRSNEDGSGGEWRVVEARVAIGANVDRPTLLPDISALIDGERLDADLAREAGNQAGATVEPVDGLHASSAYLRHLTGLLVERALLRAWRDATEEGA
jgi:CO/xanthine dehydrogenase FAD-binding subunit